MTSQVIQQTRQKEEYITRDRLTSYYNQARIIKSLGSQVNNILEIGIFNSLFTKIMALEGYQITTADYDAKLNPDLIIDLQTEFVIPHNQFDTIVLFQVLEHIPYDKFELALSKLAAATQKFLVISLPYYSNFFAINLKINTPSRPRHLLFQLPKFWETIPLSEQHYWEIGMKGYPMKKIIKSLQNTQLKLVRKYQDPYNPYHYFFVLEKS